MSARLRGLFAIAAMALSGCGKAPEPKSADGRPALPKIILQMDWYAQTEQGGYYQALVKGFYRRAGLDVTIRESGPGISGAQILSSSKGYFAIGRGDETIVQVARDIPVVMVCAQMQHDPMALLLHSESPIHSFKDLDGKSVMTVPGSNWVSYLQITDKINFSVIPLNYGMAQFMANPNFIQQCFVTNEPFYVENAGGHARTILLSDSGFDPYRVVVGNSDYVASHPEITRAFVKASLEGWNDYLNGDPTPAFKEIASRNVQMTPDFLAYSYRTMKRYKLVEGEATKGEAVGLLSRKRLQAQIDALQKIGVLDRPVTVDEVADLKYTANP